MCDSHARAANRSIGRRAFVAGAGAVTLLSAVRGRAADDPPRAGRIKIGFLGASHSHADAKLKLALKSPDYEVTGVWDESPQVVERCVKAGAKSLTQDEVLAQSTVVAVESAVRDHARLAKLALNAGKHVHLEKPPATTMAELRELVALAREKKLLLQTGYQWRHHPGINACLEAARQGWLGQVFLARATINNQLAAAQRPVWNEFKGGVMFELGGHVVDPIIRLFGKPARVTPFLRTHGGEDDFKDNTLAVFEFPKAMAVVFSATLHGGAGEQRCFELCGSQGTALVKPIEPPTLQIDLTKEAGPYKKGRTTKSWPEWGRYAGDLVELAKAVRGETALSVTLDDELTVHEALLQASAMCEDRK
jgi:predicted dehydrogenase